MKKRVRALLKRFYFSWKYFPSRTATYTCLINYTYHEANVILSYTLRTVVHMIPIYVNFNMYVVPYITYRIKKQVEVGIRCGDS
jgi:hypothetical protein